MENRTKSYYFFMIFLVIHVLGITYIMCSQCKDMYAHIALASTSHFNKLINIYGELEIIKEDNGEYPESLNDFWFYDEENCALRFNDSVIFWQTDNLEDAEQNKKKVQYEINERALVLVYLGDDLKVGGSERDNDFVIVNGKRVPYSLKDFMRTGTFFKTLILSLIISILFSLSFFKIMRKNKLDKEPSTGGMIGMLIYAGMLIIVEFGFAFGVLLAHVLPPYH
ncbi:MAG: hypothetical protein JEZ07_07245 [Phycisphaerae bacterium]|nr:hypothetical protein [Phycisphaerae bacterium]